MSFTDKIKYNLVWEWYHGLALLRNKDGFVEQFTEGRGWWMHENVLEQCPTSEWVEYVKNNPTEEKSINFITSYKKALFNAKLRKVLE